jgi:hypothetical protein
MSYVVPSVLVYQLLSKSGGVANVTPDLDALIIGPCYNVVSYVAGSTSSLTATAATDSSGAAFTLTNTTISNVVNLPSQSTGQVVDSSSVVMYLNASYVQTVYSQFTGSAGNNVITYATPTGSTGNIAANSLQVTGVVNVSNFVVGDPITVSGAGVAGTDLVTTVAAISGNTLTLAASASTASSSATLTKGTVSNTNSVTSTKRVEAGDVVVISYGSSGVFTTSVLSVASTTGTIVTITLADILPTGVGTTFVVSVRKQYNNMVLPATYNGSTNYDLSAVGATNQVTIKPSPTVGYGKVISGEVHIAYRALRTDLVGTIQEISNVDDQVAVLGTAVDTNPLGLAVEVALANTTGRILALTVGSDDLAGYVAALETTENARVYALVPLTQDQSILSALQVHVDGMSTAVNASWRMALVNTAIPTTQNIGEFNANSVNANGGNNAITLVNGSYILTASNAQFIADGVVAGDLVHITAGTSSTTSQVGTLKVLAIVNNQQLKVSATDTATAVSYYITRKLTRAQQASYVASVSSTFSDKRVVHIQPDYCGITVGGVVKYLPGYYLCAALAGLISGLPVQKGLTNIGIAGVSDLQHSNFYFTRAQLGTMAAVGTLLMVQESQGTIPYVRHELTTDMTVLQYREIQQVKNIDFLSYYFHDILKGFIGKWNITPDSLNTLRQSITSASKLLQGQKVEMIGAPLTSMTIASLEQDTDNADNVNATLNVVIPTVMNYINLYLVV